MARRNERERKRVRLVNHGFATLRQYLPQSNASRKKLSKMETLRSAIEYIKQLQFLLDPSCPTAPASAPSPQFGESSSDGPSWSASGPPSWDDSWMQQQQQQQQTTHGGRSPSPHTRLSPEADLIDFAAFT